MGFQITKFNRQKRELDGPLSKFKFLVSKQAINLRNMDSEYAKTSTVIGTRIL